MACLRRMQALIRSDLDQQTARAWEVLEALGLDEVERISEIQQSLRKAEPRIAALGMLSEIGMNYLTSSVLVE